MEERRWLHIFEVRERYGIDNNEIIRMILNGLPAYDGDHQEWKYFRTLNLKSCSLTPEQQLHHFARYFDYYDLLSYEQTHRIKPHDKRPSGRQSQIDKDAFREAAKQCWEKNPDSTIEDLISSDQTNRVLNRRSYHDKTLRNWIKDLAPNRRPGRRSASK